MPVAFNNGTTNGAGTGGSSGVTFSYAGGSGADRLLLVQTRGTATVTAVAHNGKSLTSAATGGGMTMWRRVAQDTGTRNIYIELGTYQSVLWSVSDWTGVDQTTPLGSQVTATGSSSSAATGSITCPADGAIFGGVQNDYTVGGGTATAGSGTTLVGAFRTAGNGWGKAGGRRASTGTLSWNLAGSTSWGVQGFPINPTVSFTAKLPSVYSQAIQGSVI